MQGLYARYYAVVPGGTHGLEHQSILCSYGTMYFSPLLLTGTYTDSVSRCRDNMIALTHKGVPCDACRIYYAKDLRYPHCGASRVMSGVFSRDQHIQSEVEHCYKAGLVFHTDMVWPTGANGVQWPDLYEHKLVKQLI